MKKIRLRCSYSTRAVNAKVLGRKPTSSSRDTKPKGKRDSLVKLSDKERKDRYQK